MQKIAQGGHFYPPGGLAESLTGPYNGHRKGKKAPGPGKDKLMIHLKKAAAALLAAALAATLCDCGQAPAQETQENTVHTASARQSMAVICFFMAIISFLCVLSGGFIYYRRRTGAKGFTFSEILSVILKFRRHFLPEDYSSINLKPRLLYAGVRYPEHLLQRAYRGA